MGGTYNIVVLGHPMTQSDTWYPWTTRQCEVWHPSASTGPAATTSTHNSMYTVHFK
jgi:hypothetical protein